MEAHAVLRVIDKTIWMTPHCGRGSDNERRFCVRAASTVALVVPAFLVIPLAARSYSQGTDTPPVWFWLLLHMAGGSVMATVLAVVART